MSDVDGLQSELGRVLAEHQTILYGVEERARCACGWIGDTSSWAPTLHRLDAVLPVVTAYADRVARERAAEALGDLAQRFSELGAYGAYCVAKDRADRAAALADDGQPT